MLNSLGGTNAFNFINFVAAVVRDGSPLCCWFNQKLIQVTLVVNINNNINNNNNNLNNVNVSLKKFVNDLIEHD